MKQWPGMRADASEVGGEGLSSATGVSFSIDGELRRRPGLTYLANIGGVALSAFRSPVTGAWLNVVESDGDVKAVKMSDSVVSTLLTGYSVSKRPVAAPIGPRMYWTNDFDRMKVWDGLWSALRDAGIAAPTAAMGGPTVTGGTGTITEGVHLIRYRYVDSQSPAGLYRSNPSASLSRTVTSFDDSLTWDVTFSGSPILRSTDPKVDTIQVEMTLAGGSVYYVVGTGTNNSDYGFTVNISDTLLALNEPTDLYDDFGHEQPPIAACLFECRGHAFMCGYHERTYTVAVTNGSATVTGTGFSTLWAGRLIRIGTDAVAYVISAITATTITLTSVYAGSTSAAVTSIIYTKNPNRVLWSKQGFPESFKALTRARDVLYGSGDKVVAGCDFQGDAWFFGQRSMCRLVFGDDPGTGEVNPVPGYHGLWNAKCMMPLDGAMYGWGPNGVWVITGGAPRWISRAIDATVAALYDLAQMDKAFVSYDPTEKAITWHFIATGASTPKYGMRYELTGQRWTLMQYRQGIDAATITADDYARIRLVVSDSTNARCFYHYGATDGAPSSTTGAYVVTIGGTTTAVPVLSALPIGTGADLSALILYRPSTGEERVVSSNTAGTITLSPALATAVTNGESVYVGAIPWTITTDWWVSGDLSTKARPRLQLLFHPSATGSVRLKVYRDFEASPYTWTASDADVWPDGVTLVTGVTYQDIAIAGSATLTDGFISVPMPAEWGRAWRAELSNISPAGTLKLLDLRFGVEAERDEGKETRE